MVSNGSDDLEAWFTRVQKREPEVDIHSKDLMAFSEFISKSGLQEDYANGRRKRNKNQMQGNGKGLKRNAWETGRKAAAVELQSLRKIEKEWKIVSVSRLTRGKDRHSKVLTAKGLRQRRVRLSVPTAIQLYDLQERLGLEHPNMAVDWLINAAKSAIDELRVVEEEKASASVGHVAQRTSSNCSIVDHFIGSPRESATAATGSAFREFRVGLGSDTAHGTNSLQENNRKAIDIRTTKGQILGRSNSISDGSIKGSAERTSNCSMSEPTSGIEAILKPSELGTKKSATAKNSVESPPAIHHFNSMQPSLNNLFKSIFPHTALPFESQCSNDDNPFAIHTQIMSGTGNVQQLWDYTNWPSYTDMLHTHDSHVLQNLSSSSTAPLQMSFLPMPSTPASIQTALRSFCLESYEMADSAISFFDPKESQHLGDVADQSQANLPCSNIPNMIMTSLEQQQQQQAQMNIKHYASTFVPTISNDINFSTSSLSTRGPQQSVVSSITDMPSVTRSHKDTYGEAPANAVNDFVPFQDYEVRAFQKFRYTGQRKA
jgi:hypothetical protein